jgi:membrane-associated phospholipid phosphatase
MGLSLIYLGEHYLIDILLGWVYAAVTIYLVNWGFERWGKRAEAAQAEKPSGGPNGRGPAERPAQAEPAGVGR